jgi:hypothetical protein
MTADAEDTEDACWAAIDRCKAAFASDDVHEQMAAIEAALDTWLEAGVITTEDIRADMLPHLDDVMRVMVELDPELACEHADIAIRKMSGVDGLDDAGWGALVLASYTAATDQLGISQVMTPELRETLVRASRSIETRADLACLLLHRQASGEFSPEQEDRAEAWSTSKGARREAQGILKLLGEPTNSDEAWYLQRQAPIGRAE